MAAVRLTNVSSKGDKFALTVHDPDTGENYQFLRQLGQVKPLPSWLFFTSGLQLTKYDEDEVETFCHTPFLIATRCHNGETAESAKRYSEAATQLMGLLDNAPRFVQDHRPVGTDYGWLYELRTLFIRSSSLVAKDDSGATKLWVNAEDDNNQFKENYVIFDRIDVSCHLIGDSNPTCEAGASLHFKGHYQPKAAYESLLLWLGLDGEIRMNLNNVHDAELLRMIGAIAAAGRIGNNQWTASR